MKLVMDLDLDFGPEPEEVDPPAPPPVMPKPTAPMEKARQAAESKTGASVDVLALDLNLARAATLEGVMVDIGMHTWMPTRQLSPQDSGYSDVTDLTLKQIKLGRICLLPDIFRKAFDAAKARMYRAMTDHGFKIRGFRGYFVPMKNWEKFKKGFDLGLSDLNEALDRLCRNPDKHLQYLHDTLSGDLAKTAWRGHRSTWTDGDRVAPGTFANVEIPPPEFIEEFVLRFTSLVPPETIIREKTWAHYELKILYVPEVKALIGEAKALATLGDELRDNLVRQQNELPLVFAESLAAAVTKRFQDLVDDLKTLKASNTGGITRALNNLRTKLKAMREINLAQDPRIEHVITTAERELSKAEARATAGGRGISRDTLAIILTNAVSACSTLFTPIEEDET